MRLLSLRLWAGPGWLAGLMSATLALPWLAQDAARSGSLHNELAGLDAEFYRTVCEGPI